MSFNGTNGTFNINSAGQPVVTGTVISSTAFNDLTADLATGLSTTITKDGQTTPTANIKLGGFKLTGVAAATTAGDALMWGQTANLNINGTVGATTPAAASITTLTLTNDLAVTEGGTGSSTAAAAKIALEVETAATGSTRVTVGTTAQRDGSPAAGYLRYNSSVSSFEGYSGSAWGSVGGGATGAGGDTVFQENSLIVTTSYTLTANKNASMVGPMTINSGITLTIPSGARLVIL